MTPAQVAAAEAAYDELLEAAIAGDVCDCRTCVVVAVLAAAEATTLDNARPRA